MHSPGDGGGDAAQHGDGRASGVTFAAAESGRRYSARDLSLAEEIAQRAAISIDNARLYEHAQRAARAREDLLAVVSHDLRNPLASILMSIDVLSGSTREQVGELALADLIGIGSQLAFEQLVAADRTGTGWLLG